jgi:hypothetical protein
MFGTGLGGIALAVVTGLMLADILYHWQGSNALLGTSGRVVTRESGLLAGRG